MKKQTYTRRISTLVMAAAMFSTAGMSRAGTLVYNFDSTDMNGETVLIIGNIIANNTTLPAYSFDTAVKAEGDASFRMTGTTGNQFGYYSIPIGIGLVSENGVTQNLGALDSNISFQLRNDTVGQSGVSLRIRLYKADASSAGDYVADYYTSAYGGNTGGDFVTLSTDILTSPTTLASGWAWGTGYGVDDLTNIALIRIQPSWSAGTSGLSMDYHLDNLILSGSGVSVVPEPATIAMLLLGLFLIAARRRTTAR